ncbi:MAG TPA: dihydrofolate reductase [Telluria sp.]|jgi:dihydrofolate reductase
MAKHITLVVAMDAERGIGIDNKLPWHLPEDLAHFKRVTLGHPIIMGRKTFDSIGRPLPGRRNIVVTRNPDWRHAGVESASSLEDAVAMVGIEAASIIGGAQIFKEALGVADRMIVTHIERSYHCDAFFPEIDPGQWTATSREPQHAQAEDLDFSFVTYDRIR